LTLFYQSIDNFLANYPNETDVWEVLAENPALDSLQIDLDLLPTNKLPYERASIVAIA
jgi:hypothetical protein